MVGSDSGGEVAQFFYLELTEGATLIRKTDIGKLRILM